MALVGLNSLLFSFYNYAVSFQLNTCLFSCLLLLISFVQVGFQEHWLEVLRTYIVPIQVKVYPGYYSRVSCGVHPCLCVVGAIL